MTFTAGGTENLMRWDRRARPFMEVWYATVTHRERRSGLWLRYTIASPSEGDASCALWAFYFDSEGKRSFAGRNVSSADRLGFAPGRDDGALVRIGDAWLSETQLDGAVGDGARTLSWSLDFDPANRSYRHLPPLVNGIAERKFSTLCSPNLAVPFTGTVRLDGETISYEGERGQQSHRWGRRHARSWAWAHCSTWEDGGDAVFEGLSAKSSNVLPALTFLYLRFRGDDLYFGDARGALRARSTIDPPVWSFAASNARWKIAGSARLVPDRSIQVRYDDPDGGERHCTNSEIADLMLEVYERTGRTWGRVATLESKGLAHFELGRPEPFPELPVAF